MADYVKNVYCLNFSDGQKCSEINLGPDCRTQKKNSQPKAHQTDREILLFSKKEKQKNSSNKNHRTKY